MDNIKISTIESEKNVSTNEIHNKITCDIGHINYDLKYIYDWFFERKAKFYKIGWAYLYNQYDVEDVFHNTIIKVNTSIKQLRNVEFFETWVTAIFINECKAILRKKKRTGYMQDIKYDEIYDDKYNSFEIKDYLCNLDQIHKDVLVLKYISGYSQDDIAKVLKIPVGTVKSRIFRGLKQLRDIMKGDEESDL